MIEMSREEYSKLWKMMFFSMFSRFGPFPHPWWKLKEWLISELHEMVKVPPVVAYPLDFVIEVSREKYSNL